MGTACEASKTKPPYVFTDVIVDRLWVPFSPCGHRAPVFPSIASGYAIPVWPPIPALPVTLRIASPCQLPASRPAPPVHPRKRAVLSEILNRITEIHHDREINGRRHDSRRCTICFITVRGPKGDAKFGMGVSSCKVCAALTLSKGTAGILRSVGRVHRIKGSSNIR